MKFYKLSILSLTICLTTMYCEQNKKDAEMELSEKYARDLHSYSKPNEAVVTHLDWQADIDFEKKQITATATYQIVSTDTTNELILDTNGLTISSVKNAATSTPLSFEIGEYQEHFGSPLSITIDSSVKSISITYATGEDAAALQWLDPVQTAGKESPFLFTQSQAILARSWIPIQDSPGIRVSYTAQVQVPKGLMALMSAENPIEKNETGLYSFTMKQKIPAYLFALAVGDLEFQSMGKRTGVYGEPSIVQKAAYEFDETEQMIQAAEGLYGPYQWERYDILVLPPSFPFGGMENPRLTFATPTILAGDRSLTSLIAHELAHSWSGNLVTNATWNDFWLNEGFTVYFEQRIMEAVYGRQYSEMLAALSLQDLMVEIDEMIESGRGDDTRLKLDLTGRNPDDGVTTVAYDKGYNFLRLIEETVGREKFDVFLKQYFTEHAFEVMDTERFLTYLKENLFDTHRPVIAPDFYETWIYQSGLPENHPNPISDKFNNVELAIENWIANEDRVLLESQNGSDNWSSHEWQHFLKNLPEGLSSIQMEALDTSFEFSQSGNSEVLELWLLQVVKNEYKPSYDKLEEFLVNTGRRKFLTPLYIELMKFQEGKKMAADIYNKARPNYHFVATNTIDEIVGFKE